jgi:hypothetical protein
MPLFRRDIKGPFPPPFPLILLLNFLLDTQSLNCTCLAMSSEQPQKYPRQPEGTPCWIEIPTRDLQKMKVGDSRPEQSLQLTITDLLLHHLSGVDLARRGRGRG